MRARVNACQTGQVRVCVRVNPFHVIVVHLSASADDRQQIKQRSGGTVTNTCAE